MGIIETNWIMINLSSYPKLNWTNDWGYWLRNGNFYNPIVSCRFTQVPLIQTLEKWYGFLTTANFLIYGLALIVASLVYGLVK